MSNAWLRGSIQESWGEGRKGTMVHRPPLILYKQLRGYLSFRLLTCSLDLLVLCQYKLFTKHSPVVPTFVINNLNSTSQSLQEIAERSMITDQ